MAEALAKVDAESIAGRQFRTYDFAMAAFVTLLLLSNLIGAGKVAEIDLPIIGPWPFGAGVLFFPLSYVLGDVMTEVYGYSRARRCVWAGFAALAYMALMSFVVVALPPASNWTGQAHYAAIFGQTPRIVLASMCAFCAGEFTNSYVLARMKIATGGRHLWMRTIGSTVVGEAVDSLIFYPVAFAGRWSTELLLKVLVTQYVLKVSWEVILTPVTYRVIGWLKRVEQVDVFDTQTDFTPFRTKL